VGVPQIKILVPYSNYLIYRPESLGLVAASIYILSLILFIPFAFSKPIIEQSTVKKPQEGITVVEFPHYQVCLTSTCLLPLIYSHPACSIFIIPTFPSCGNITGVSG